MKVYLNMSGPLSPLYRHFNLDGDAVTSHQEEADLIISDPIQLPQFMGENNQVIGEPSIDTTNFAISRYFNGHEWLEQTIISIQLCGLMNGDLGSSVCTGSGTRYLKSPERFASYFDEYKPALEELGLKDFVSFMFKGNGTFIGAQTSIPFYGLFGVLEGVRGKLSEWFSEPNRLYESWVVSLLVSTYPFPVSVVNKEIVLPKISEQVEKHFWSFPKLIQQSQGLIGISTAWAGIEDDEVEGANGSLQRANNFALKTAGNIDVNEKQYRTDLASKVREKWVRLKNTGII